MFKKDSFLLGFIPALLTPMLGVYIFYLIFFHYMDFTYFCNHIISSQKWVSVISLGAILNLGLFFFFYRREWDSSAKGVIAATFLYAFVVVYFKAF